MALDMIRMAKNAGADYVKFQKRTVDLVYTGEFLDSPRNSPWGTTQREQKNGIELTMKDFDAIDRFCKELDIPWFASSWDGISLDQMDSFKPPFHKIASAMAHHRPFVATVARKGRPIIMSTGGLERPEIHDRVRVIREVADVPITLLHCTPLYPCPDELTNVRVIEALQQEFPHCGIGYSGHEVGLLPSILAAGLGVVMIERHITLDRAIYGSDQAASLEKRGLELLCKDAKAAQSVLGSPDRRIMQEEKDVLAKMQYWRNGKNV